MRKIRSKRFLGLLMAMAMTASFAGCGKDEDKKSTMEATEAAVATPDAATSSDPLPTDVSEDEVEVPAGYNLVWHDEFNGTELSEADWNYEEHEKGWVNNELQSYVPSSEYAYVKDGELVIQPTKTEDENGNPVYTSGRVNTQNKHDIKDGWIEARIKVPQGKGFLPAFWMMPQDES